MLLVPTRRRKMRVYDGKVLGHEVSEYGLKHGYLDYEALSNMLGIMVFDNEIIEDTSPDDWVLVNGDGESSFSLVLQYFIISYPASCFLEHNTDELVFYNNVLDIYVWGVTHWGTSWDYVLTDIELVVM